MTPLYWIILGGVVFFVGGMISGYIGLIGLAILVYGIYRYFSDRSSSMSAEKGNVRSDEKAYRFGNVTVFPEKGYLQSGKNQVQVSEVRNVVLHQNKSGWFGGGVARIDIVTNNFDTPVIQTRISAVTRNEMNKQYHRLAMLLNCSDLKHSIEH